MTGNSTDSPTGAPDSGELLLQLLQSSFSSARYNAKSVLAGLILFFGGSLALFIVFCFMRPRHNLIYAPKLKYSDKGEQEFRKPTPLTKNPFTWIMKVFKISEDELIEKLGIDAAIFIRFHRMCRNMFFLISVVACGVVIPINVYFNLQSQYADSLRNANDIFILMTPSLVTGLPLVAHVALGWIIDMIVLTFLWVNFKKVISIRRKTFMSKEYQRALFMKTLLITEISKKYASDEGIVRLMSKLNCEQRPIQQANVGRNVNKLSTLLETHRRAILALESYLAKYLKNPDRLPSKRPQCKPMKGDRGHNHTGKVDAIEYYIAKIKTLQEEISVMRANIDAHNTLSYGFVSYNSQEDCHVVAKSASNGRKKGVLVHLAPRPEDIIWKNIVLGRMERGNKQWWGNVFFVVMMIAWIVPNAFIGCFLGDLSRIGVLWHGFQTYMNAHQTLFAVLQGVLSPVVTSLIFLILPLIMRRMSQWQGKLTKNEREHDVTGKLYAFFFFNNFFVFTLMSVAWNIVSQVVNFVDTNSDLTFEQAINKLAIGQQISTAVIDASSFWVMYILKANLGAVVDLLQLFSLLWNAFRRLATSPTPRQQMLWTAPQHFNFAIYYIWLLFYATIALAFTTIQPIILPLLTVYLAFDIVIKKYCLMYMFVTKAESDGMFWPLLHNCMLFATAMGNLVLLCVVWIKGGWIMAMAVVPLPIVVIIFKIVTASKFNPLFYYFMPSNSEREAMELQASLNGKWEQSSILEQRYQNPAINERLPVPMVHAKAQHLLPMVCNSDNNDIFDDDVAYGQHKMDANKFDIVREDQLDYEHYQRMVEDATPGVETDAPVFEDHQHFDDRKLEYNSYTSREDLLPVYPSTNFNGSALSLQDSRENLSHGVLAYHHRGDDEVDSRNLLDNNRI
jgi:hypothetical protein